MGIITLEKVDYLYWLGRYTERTYTTVSLFKDGYDEMIDNFEDSYIGYCRRLQIPNIYTSKQDFIDNYAFDTNNADSIISNLTRAYDNAVYMRDEIGSPTLSYIQMAIYDIQAAKISAAPMIRMQHVIDNILAFWGCIEDQIDDDKIRNVIKLGKRVERLDLSLRFHEKQPIIKKELMRLSYSLAKTVMMSYNADELELVHMAVDDDEIDYKKALKHLENIFTETGVD